MTPDLFLAEETSKIIECNQCHSKFKIDKSALPSDSEDKTKYFVRCIECDSKIFLADFKDPELVNIRCPECESEYAISRDKFVKPKLKVRCFVCHHSFDADVHGYQKTLSTTTGKPDYYAPSSAAGHKNLNPDALSLENLKSLDAGLEEEESDPLDDELKPHETPPVPRRSEESELPPELMEERENLESMGLHKQMETADQQEQMLSIDEDFGFEEAEGPKIEPKPVSTLGNEEMLLRHPHKEEKLTSEKSKLKDADMLEIGLAADELNHPENDLYDLSYKELENHPEPGSFKNLDPLAKAFTGLKALKLPEIPLGLEETYLASVRLNQMDMGNLESVGTIPPEQKYKIFKMPNNDLFTPQARPHKGKKFSWDKFFRWNILNLSSQKSFASKLYWILIAVLALLAVTGLIFFIKL